MHRAAHRGVGSTRSLLAAPRTGRARSTAGLEQANKGIEMSESTEFQFLNTNIHVYITFLYI